MKDKINIGIDIGGSHIGFALVNNAGKILFKSTSDTKNHISPKNIIMILAKQVEMLCNKAMEYNKQYVENIGIGIPGIIDCKKGVIVNSPNLDELKNFPLKKMLVKKLVEKNLNMPVFIDNDANCAAFGEYKYGAGKIFNSKLMIHLTLGTGIGSGIIMNEHIFSGISNNAGELGHMVIKFDGKPCACGNRGCWEAYCGTKGFIDSAKYILNKKTYKTFFFKSESDIEHLNPAIVCKGAQKKDLACKMILKFYGKNLGVGIANIINIFNCDLVSIGGGISKSGKLFIDDIKKEVNRRAFKFPANRCKITLSKLGVDAGIIGASILYQN